MIAVAPADLHDVMSAQEAADYLGVAEKSVRRWIADGKLVATKRGRAFAIRKADVITLRASQLGGRRAREGARLEAEAARASSELAELRGRYAEVKERADRLERELADERRRAVSLELRLESIAA